MDSRVESFIRGLGAGVIGTIVMTGWQDLSRRLRTSTAHDGHEAPPRDERERWERAPVPAKVAKLMAERVLRVSVSADLIPLLSGLMHWSYGTGWGGVYGVLKRPSPRGAEVRDGVLFGAAVWLMSYAQLVPLGLYEPPWRYPISELGLDLSYHLAYGTGTSVGFSALERVSRRPL
jgi:uncharacterized membrane protein YagU involved in acid resistance